MRHAYKADIDFCSKIDNIVLNGESRGNLDKLHEAVKENLGDSRRALQRREPRLAL